MKKVYLYFSSAVVIAILSISSGIGALVAGQSILQQKCTKCHGLKIPENYTKAEWKYNVERMAKRAELTPLEIQSLIDLNNKK